MCVWPFRVRQASDGGVDVSGGPVAYLFPTEVTKMKRHLNRRGSSTPDTQERQRPITDALPDRDVQVACSLAVHFRRRAARGGWFRVAVGSWQLGGGPSTIEPDGTTCTKPGAGPGGPLVRCLILRASGAVADSWARVPGAPTLDLWPHRAGCRARAGAPGAALTARTPGLTVRTRGSPAVRGKSPSVCKG